MKLNKIIVLEDYSPLSEYELVEDGDEGNKKYYLKGIFSKVDTPNKNKRIYPRSVMESAIDKVKPLMEQRGLVGELDHPDSGMRINVGKISHVITELDLNHNGEVIGKAEVLNTTEGNNLQRLMEAKVKLGVSTRGNGMLEPYQGSLGEGFFAVKEGTYDMKAIDVVFDPSANTFPEYVKEETEEKVQVGHTVKFGEVWESVFGEGS